MKQDIARAKWSTMAVLFCNGVLYSTWGVFVPVVKARFHLTDTLLSLAMVSVALGGIATMSLAGRWIARVGSGRASIQSGILMAVSAACILSSPQYSMLLIVLVVYGIATAANDVAANAQGAHLESISKTSVVGFLHGSFSLGGLAGSTLSGLASSSFAYEVSAFGGLSAIVVVTMLVSARHLRNEDASNANPDGENEAAQSRDSFSPTARRRLIALGAMAFLGLVLEGVVYDWSTVYMREVVHAPPFAASLAYAVFAIGMAAGRIGGDRIRDQFPLTWVVSVSGAVCFVGLVMCVTLSRPWLVTAAFFITGIGLSNVIPIMFSSAGKVSKADHVLPSRGLAITTRIAYTGLLVGPLIVGPLSDRVGLVHAIAVLSATPILVIAGWLLLNVRTHGAPWQLSSDRSSLRTTQES